MKLYINTNGFNFKISLPYFIAFNGVTMIALSSFLASIGVHSSTLKILSSFKDMKKELKECSGMTLVDVETSQGVKVRLAVK